MKALVTGLFTQAGVFAVRRFGELGIEVTAADNHALAIGMHSKYVTKKVLLPNLRKDPLGYARALIEELETGEYDYYFPAFEEQLLMSNYRDKINSLVSTTLPERDLLMRLHDKAALQKTAEAAGVKYPETFKPRSIDEAEAIIDSIDYPVYVKMRQTSNSTGLRLIEDPQKLRDAYYDVIRRNDLDENQLPLIQRRVVGPEVVVSALAQNGNLISGIPYMGVRCIPRSGGTTVCRQTVVSDQIIEEAKKIIVHTRWSGFIGMDFLVDDQTGDLYVIDCNTRPSVGINVAHFAGADLLPEWMKVADHHRATPCLDYEPGKKTATHFADLWWYVQTFFQGPESWSERVQLRREWRANRDELDYDYYRKGDAWPVFILWIFVIWQSVKLLFTKYEQPDLFLFYNSFHEERYFRQLGYAVKGSEKRFNRPAGDMTTRILLEYQRQKEVTGEILQERRRRREITGEMINGPSEIET
jgi:predicted ATP-grasp superfamily ATP-dependent carboligase